MATQWRGTLSPSNAGLLRLEELIVEQPPPALSAAEAASFPFAPDIFAMTDGIAIHA